MRTIVTGITVFVLWSALCTWYYVTRIKGPGAGEAPAVEQTAAEMDPAEPGPEPMIIEPESQVESPGSFTVYHAFNRIEVLPDAAFERYIDQLLAFRADAMDTKLNLTGHTDNIGSEAYNDRLGLSRAQSTRDYLVSKGFPANMIHITSRGESEPAATNETDSGRAQNRRTEIEIVE